MSNLPGTWDVVKPKTHKHQSPHLPYFRAMPSFYIAVPTNPSACGYWKNYKFTGTYKDAAIRAIGLLRDSGYFEGYIKLITNDTEIDDDLTFFCKQAWYNQDYDFLWRNTPKYFAESGYFAEYLRFDDYDVCRGIIDWDTYWDGDGNAPRNWHENAEKITDLTPSSSHEETDEESDEESDEEDE